jgi:hypothetical protein
LPIYDINKADDFERLFANTYIGQNPTALHNSFLVLYLNFSTINPNGNIEDIEESFDTTCNLRLKTLIGKNKKYLKDKISIDVKEKMLFNLKSLLNIIEEYDLPRLYIIIDEYDNFANQLITA